MKKIKFLIVLLLCFMFIPVTQAKTINHFYDEAGEDITFNDEVNGSSAFAGQNVESNGKVSGVNFLAGNKVEHTGYSDYLACAGNSITISGEVNNDSIIAGNIINIKKGAQLKRDVIIFGEDITIKGALGRNANLYGNKVSLEGVKVNGNVKVYAKEISVDKDSVIGGTLSYPEDAKVVVEGNVNNVKKTAAMNKDLTNDFITIVTDKCWSYLSLLIIFAVLTLLVPKLFDKINDRYETLDFNKGIEVIAKGLVFLMIVPIIAVFLLVVPFALPLSLIMFILYFIIIYISKIFAMYLLGYKLWQKYFKKDINMLLIGILGFITIFIFDLIPGINYIVSLLTLLVGVGIISNFLFQKNVKKA